MRNLKNYFSNYVRLLIVVVLVQLMSFGCGGDDELAEGPVLQITNFNVSGFGFSYNESGSPMRLQVSTQESFSTIAFDNVYNESPATVNGLESATDYFVRGQFTDGPSAFSIIQEFTTSELTTPTNITTDLILGDEFRVRWDEVPGATYSIDIAYDDAFTDLVEGYSEFPVQTNEVTVEVPQIETTYYFRVMSVNGSQSSVASASGTVTTTDRLLFTFRSSAFTSGGKIPVIFACQSPSVPLEWKNPPEGTESLALIMDDLDFVQGVYNHWVVFNLPENSTGLRDGASRAAMPIGTVEGTNGLGGVGYFGPCAPAGQVHRYEFKLYALDRDLTLPSTTRKAGLLAAMQGHVLGTKTIIGNYN